jgi:hypothetical protein
VGGFQENETDRRSEGKDPYEGIAPRGKDFIRARIPKKLKEGMTKFNEPEFEEVEKALIKASKDSGGFEVRRL